MKFLVETALLGHGLISISDEEILEKWPENAKLAWIENGKKVIGDIDQFIIKRKNSSEWTRLDGLKVMDTLSIGLNAFLTASGTMAVAKEFGYQIVVSAGIGGIGDIVNEKLSYDLIALSQWGITLIATSPKDMLNIPETLSWLNTNKVKVFGYNTKVCDGYILNLDKIQLDNTINENTIGALEMGCNLILNPIPQNIRLQDNDFLNIAIEAGKKAEKLEKEYHPAANACFDNLSNGLSSKIQLKALIDNIKIAELIIKDKQ